MAERLDVLMVSLAAPPKVGSESLQVERVIRELSKDLSIRVTLATEEILGARSSGWDAAHLGEPSATIPGRVIRLRTMDRFWIRGLLRRSIPWALHLPDPKALFHLRWRSIARRVEGRPAVVYSRSTPFSSAICGSKLATALQAPLVTHLSDPWMSSPIRPRLPRWIEGWNQRWEAACVDASAAVTFSSMATLDRYGERYPHRRGDFHWIPNSFDQDALNPHKDDLDEGPLTLVHTGNLYADRSPRCVVEALRLLRERPAWTPGRVRVRFIGFVEPSHRETLAAAPEGTVEVFSRMAPAQAVNEQRRAHGLILLDTPGTPEPSPFLPSKLLDYMAARRPILAVTRPGSEVSRILGEGCAHFLVEPDRPQDLAQAIDTLLSWKEAGNEDRFWMPSPSPWFSASETVGRLTALLREASHR